VIIIFDEPSCPFIFTLASLCTACSYGYNSANEAKESRLPEDEAKRRVDQERTLRMNIWINVVIFAGVSTLLTGSPHSTVAGEAETSQFVIRIEQYPPTQLMLAKHVGPYWEAGPLFQQATALMQATKQQGRMLTYYPRNPLNVPATRLVGEIGFFVDKESAVEPPFSFKTMPAYQAAVVSVDIDYGQTQRFYSQLERFIRNRGLQPAGPLMEIYDAAYSGDQNLDQKPRTEIRMWIKAQPNRINAPDVLANPRETAKLTPHEELAVLLIPDPGDCPDGYRRWMSKIVNRLRAIREAAAVKYAEDPPELIPLVDTIVARGRRMAELRDSIEANANDRQLQMLLQQLDDLLVDILLQQEDGEVLTQEVTGVISELTAIIHAETDPERSTRTEEANR
jgi:hypothetical protein